jgi:Chromo (CHRromatin Organisation MOdifier) domain
MPLPSHSNSDELDKYLCDLSGDQLFIFESLQAKRYEQEEDGTLRCMVLVKWEGFSVEDSTWEDPVEAGLCKADEVEDYTALLLDCTENPGMSYVYLYTS